MIFNINSNLKQVIDGFRIAENVLVDSEFHDRIAIFEKFTYTQDNPITVFVRLKGILDQSIMINVEEYWCRSANVIGTTFKNKPGIFINRNGASRRDASVYLANAIHEFCHFPLGYGHGSNFPPGSWRGRLLGDWEDKNLSVPHSLSRIGVEVAIKKGLLG